MADEAHEGVSSDTTPMTLETLGKKKKPEISRPTFLPRKAYDTIPIIYETSTTPPNTPLFRLPPTILLFPAATF